jgi:hypothetical protein
MDEELRSFDTELVDGWQGEVRRHSRDYVRWVQQALNGILGLSLAIDGILGPKTRGAIRRFQAIQGLSVDGNVGPQTERALVKAGAGSQPSVSSPSRPITFLPPQPLVGDQALRSNIARIAMEELLRWGNGKIKETSAIITPVLEDYWQTGIGFLPHNWRSLPWSGAFISWVMRKAGAGSAFEYSSSHTKYVAAAKRNRLTNNSNPLKAYRVTEAMPRVGDLVCLERQDADGSWSGVNYDNVDDGNFRASHSDIVVQVQAGKLLSVGGNVSNSVGKKGVKINDRGLITAPRYYAVVRVGL